jgi:hypothetical protein
MIDNDIEKARFNKNGQLPLFPVKPIKVCSSIGLNWLAVMLKNQNWFFLVV